jgi:protein ImuB
MYACLYRPPAPDGDHDQRRARGTRREEDQNFADSASFALSVVVEIAGQFSPRYECHGDDLVVLDVSGLERLLGPARTIGEEMRRDAARRGVRAHVAIAGTQTAAILLALATPGLTVIARGEEAQALAALPIAMLERIQDDDPKRFAACAALALNRWGLKTLGDLAALPAAGLAARAGKAALIYQAMARGEDRWPLVPMREEERFEASLELDWPIAELEPLSFVLTRLLEPISIRLEKRDRGAAVLHVLLRLAARPSCGAEPRETYARRLELPTPIRDVRTLRTLALLDLDAHPAPAAFDRVTLVIDPTPGRVLQHTLFTRAHPTPEQISTLLARLHAVMGQDRVGAPAMVDSYRPGAFAMVPFATDHDDQRKAREARKDDNDQRRIRGTRGETSLENSAVSASSALIVDPLVVAALRRCRQPVPARVTVMDGRPVRVTTDRRGYAGGAVTACAGPWRTSGEWWLGEAGGAGGAGEAGGETQRPVPPVKPVPPILPSWDRDEWDVALGDGALYRIFQDRAREVWFIDAIAD